ncbi:MAG TPA: 50S ribosomal protein L11 methyltransferase [Casimicrobiaceae bacterium]|nr:50S ribosomal protein L11 methyltransferase [Casimicrobiaceae bacterium]
MAFVALRFDAPAATAEAWSDAMLAAGAASVDAADANAGTGDETPRYGEPGHEGALWSVCRLTALFAADADVEASVRRAAASLGVETPAFTLENLAEQDWVRRTQAQFGPLRIADGLWVIPSWCEPVDPQAINLELDPGLAFGTGSHPTTRLCLRWLAANLVPGQSVLDYGCGSGILAIAAAKLGAAAVAGTDVDPQAIEASRANAARNGVRARFVLPDALAPDPVDVIVANILANPLRLLAPVLAARVRHGGAIVLSGILEDQVAAVRGAYRRWFKLAAWGTDDGWVALTGRRTSGK